MKTQPTRVNSSEYVFRVNVSIPPPPPKLSGTIDIALPGRLSVADAVVEELETTEEIQHLCPFITALDGTMCGVELDPIVQLGEPPTWHCPEHDEIFSEAQTITESERLVTGTPADQKINQPQEPS